MELLWTKNGKRKYIGTLLKQSNNWDAGLIIISMLLSVMNSSMSGLLEFYTPQITEFATESKKSAFVLMFPFYVTQITNSSSKKCESWELTKACSRTSTTRSLNYICCLYSFSGTSGKYLVADSAAVGACLTFKQRFSFWSYSHFYWQGLAPVFQTRGLVSCLSCGVWLSPCMDVWLSKLATAKLHTCLGTYATLLEFIFLCLAFDGKKCVFLQAFDNLILHKFHITPRKEVCFGISTFALQYFGVGWGIHSVEKAILFSCGWYLILCMMSEM